MGVNIIKNGAILHSGVTNPRLYPTASNSRLVKNDTNTLYYQFKDKVTRQQREYSTVSDDNGSEIQPHKDSLSITAWVEVLSQQIDIITVNFVAFYLNQYLTQIANTSHEEGGDVFKFAGGAIIIISPSRSPQSSTIEERNKTQATLITCTTQIQQDYHNFRVCGDIKLSVKIDIEYDKTSILFIDSQFGRIECLCSGESLSLPFNCKPYAQPDEQRVVAVLFVNSDKQASSGMNNMNDVVFPGIFLIHVLENEFTIRISYDLDTIDRIIVKIDAHDASFVIEIDFVLLIRYDKE